MKFCKVYDISVEDTHEFFANGILVHNCFGYNAVAFSILDGAIVAIRDYEITNIQDAPRTFRMDFPTQRIVWIPDATTKRSNFAMYKKELISNRIFIMDRASNPMVEDRIFAINKLFFTQKLFITPICEDLEKNILTYSRDLKTGVPKKGGEGAPDHKIDCMGYVVSFIIANHPEFKDIFDIVYRNRFMSEAETRSIKGEIVSAYDL